MNKTLINLLCAFIPKKQLRKKIRNEMLVKYVKDKANQRYYADFVKFLETKDNKENFVPIANSKISKEPDTKLLAFYLPQFYPIALNNSNHGQGFTEWFNVTKAQSLFCGHHQPQLPIDVGFYDLSYEDVMFRQIELAKLYGIAGFCSYYYWFSGEKLLNKPFENYLNNKKLDFPFCFCWALENWTRIWDAGNKELIIEQKFQDDDCQKFFDDMLPYFQDERYIKISSKPLLLVYKPHIFPKEKIKRFFDNLRQLAKNHNIKDLYLIYARTSEMFENNVADNDPAQWGFDAYVDFPPHNLRNNKNQELNVPLKKVSGYINPNFEGLVYDMCSFVEKEIYKNNANDSHKLFKACFPSWDNTPRFPKNGSIMYGLTPHLYKQWLRYCIDWTKQNHDKDEQIVFINAWNEWAEGAHLEPDRKFGYAYLQATREVLEEN